VQSTAQVKLCKRIWNPSNSYWLW